VALLRGSHILNIIHGLMPLSVEVSDQLAEDSLLGNAC
jgi:hypothetical protein